MKKKLILATLLVAMLFLSACASKQANNKNANNNPNSPDSRGRRMPDFGQPDRQADISGLVKSISGNQVTIIKMDWPNRDRNATGTPGNFGNNRNNNQRQNPTNITRGITGGTGGSGGGRFMGGPGMGGGPPGEQDENSRTAMLEQIKKMSTGEITVTIPVGIKMLKPDTAGTDKQPTMVEATLADITIDKMINIWTDEADNNASSTSKIASFVLIIR